MFEKWLGSTIAIELLNQAVSTSSGHTVTSYHRRWCDYLDFTIVDDFFFSRCFVSFQDFPRYIFGCLWFLVVQGLLSSTLQFFAKPSGPMFLRFIDHRMWLFLIRAAQVVPACQPGCEKMEREWENEEEMEREWGNGERFTLYIFSFSIYFLPLYPFSISKIVSFCCKMLKTALLLRILQKINIRDMRK